jgi:glyoxylase-like metal-dependent hydrolase (beta-lactamase superfamily II)
MQLIPNVHVLDTYAHTVLLTEQRLVLVDTSMEKEPAKIRDYLAHVKVKPTDLTSILVTHTHGDHVNGLAWMKRLAPNAKVACHEVEAPFISKEKVYPGPPRPAGHDGVKVDVRLKDGQSFEGFTVLHTPGHTLGHMSLHDPKLRLLIAGDALRTEGGVQPMEDVYNADPKQHRAQIKRLAQLDVETLVCGHGPPIARGAGAQLKAAAAKL